MKLADLYDEWCIMRAYGLNDHEIARALGINVESLRRAIQRHRSRWPEGTGTK